MNPYHWLLIGMLAGGFLMLALCWRDGGPK